MRKGISLHIGLNSIDPAYYGDPAVLKNPENDANAMEKLALAEGFQAKKLLTAGATANNVLSEIYKAATLLQPGDTFLLTYAGHGAQVRDLNKEEADGYDETWVLYDRMLIDDEIYNCWSRFSPGVRIIVLSDSCHSGTVVRFFDLTKLDNIYFPKNNVYRCLDTELAKKAFTRDIETYQSIKYALRGDQERNVGATVLLISGCQDNQLSSDGDQNGLFTAELLNTWQNGSFVGDYRHFHVSIRSNMPPIQVPNFMIIGTPNPLFEKQRPFTINEQQRESEMLESSAGVNRKEATFLLQIPKEELENISEDHLKNYFKEKGGDILFETYKSVSETASCTYFTRATGGLDIGCKVEKDKWSCEGRLSIRF